MNFGEIWKQIVDWYNASGFSMIFESLIGVFVVVYNFIASNKLKASKLKEISSVATNKVLTEKINLSNEDISNKINAITTELKGSACILNGVVPTLLIIIQNSKIDPKSKQLALKTIELIGKGEPSVKQEEKLEDVVNEIKESVEQEVAESVEKEESGQLDSLVENLLSEVIDE